MAWIHNGRKYWTHNGKLYSKEFHRNYNFISSTSLGNNRVYKKSNYTNTLEYNARIIKTKTNGYGDPFKLEF